MVDGARHGNEKGDESQSHQNDNDHAKLGNGGEQLPRPEHDICLSGYGQEQKYDEGESHSIKFVFVHANIGLFFHISKYYRGVSAIMVIETTIMVSKEKGEDEKKEIQQQG